MKWPKGIQCLPRDSHKNWEAEVAEVWSVDLGLTPATPCGTMQSFTLLELQPNFYKIEFCKN